MNEMPATSALLTDLALVRGARIPKRIVEGWIGAAAQSVGLRTGIWGSTFRRADGVGVQPACDLLLLQCSPAEKRTWGLSTRVNGRGLATYVANPYLRAWEEHAQFVLPSVSIESDRTISLWLISAKNLAAFIEEQGRCTVNQEALEELAKRGAALRFEDVLRSWTVGQPMLRPPSGVKGPLVLDESPDLYGFARFDFNAPTPLGLVRDTSAETRPTL